MEKISILITPECPMDCPNCYYEKNIDECLDIENNIKFGRCLRQIGCKAITLSGGDPLLYEGIVDISQEFKQMGFNIHLDTTGLSFIDGSLNQYDIDKLSKSIDLIGLPLDGSDDNKIKIFRPEHNLNIAQKTFDLLQGSNFNMSVNTVLHDKNKDDLNDVYKLIARYKNINRWELHQFVDFKNQASDLDITDKDFSESINKIDNYKNINISPKFSQN
jgi:MoaA/NifB/PqqE/SkfB family radical SAM enzyme